MDKNLLAQWQANIIGDWLEAWSGVDLLYLEPVAGRAPLAMCLRADGTASIPDRTAGEHTVPSAPEAPFPETWELSEDRVLSLVVPIPPMPEYELPDWTREHMSFDVLAVTDLSLTLSDRRFDGDMVTVWKRVNREEYDRRRADEYRQALEGLKRLVGK